MSGAKLMKFVKHLNFYSLSVLIGIIIANFFPLRPIYQQALVGVALIWFNMELMLGFPIWHS
jgi:hypothetical protein